jgi:hypothetical protein
MAHDFDELIFFALLHVYFELINAINFLTLDEGDDLLVVQPIRFEDELFKRVVQVVTDVLAAEVERVAADFELGHAFQVFEHALHELVTYAV